MKFRFLDGVLSSSLEGQGKIVTHVTFPQTEDYLAGPFHASLQVPFTLVLEAMAQSGGRLIEFVSESRLVGLMIKVDEAQFSAPVSAGERLVVRSELLGIQDKNGATVGLARTRSQALVAEKPVAEAHIAFLCIPTKGWK